MSAIRRIADSNRTSPQVRKVPKPEVSFLGRYRVGAEAPYATIREIDQRTMSSSRPKRDARPPLSLRPAVLTSLLTTCTIRMPFLATNPIRTTMPIWP
jgi:hypothetical protein